MAINRAVGEINPGGVLNGTTIRGGGTAGLQTVADRFNHIYTDTNTTLLQWPSRNPGSGVEIGVPKAADPGDTFLIARVRQPADRSSWVFRVSATIAAGTLDVSLQGSTDGEIARVQFSSNGTLEDTATVTTAEQTLTVKVLTASATDAIITSIILYLDDE